MGLGVSPLRGAGPLRCASSRRGTGVSPLDGLPSLTRIRSGRRSRLKHAAARSRARGSRAPIPSRCARTRPAWRTDRLAGRCARCGAGQIATPVTRHARSRAAEDRVQRSARSGCAAAKPAISGSTAAPFAALGVTSAAEPPLLVNVRSASLQPLRQASWHIGRDAAPPVGRRQHVRQSSHRAPPTAPPSNCEGDLWGDLQAVGRETGSLLRLLMTPPIPNPFP